MADRPSGLLDLLSRFKDQVDPDMLNVLVKRVAPGSWEVRDANGRLYDAECFELSCGGRRILCAIDLDLIEVVFKRSGPEAVTEFVAQELLAGAEALVAECAHA